MRLPPLTILVLALAVSGCAGTAAPGVAQPPSATPATHSPTAGPAQQQSPPASGAWDWPVYHHDQARSGYAPATPPAGDLSIAWTRHLDGAVYGQPLAVGGLVIAATEGGSVYGLDRASGAVRWRAHIGTPVPLSSLPCGDIDPLGITGTPVYDPATGLVYAVAETTGYRHLLAGVSVATGHIRFTRHIPTPDGHSEFDQQRAALALAAGRVYIAFGGLDGDCGLYQGSVVGVPASGHGHLVSYLVPTIVKGGIWATGGPVVGPAGALYVSVGNGRATHGQFDGSDSVTALTSDLHRTGIFAPATWGADNLADLDLGSMAPAVLPSGMILAVGKRGIGYLLDGSRLGGVAGQVATALVCPAYGGPAVRGTVVYIPCEGGGMAAVDTSGHRIHVLWRGPPAAMGSPVLGGGAIWVTDWDAGTLYQLDAATGQVRRTIGLGSSLPHFASPSLSGPLVLVGTRAGVVAVSGA
jgi:outer membrane protein assembly factor BamB